jgi:DNA-binding LacI/PurR family transcriptional regulator
MPPSDWGVVDSLRNPVFDLFLLGVAEVCDEFGANLVIVHGRTDNGGIKTALVDGFIFGRVEHPHEVEPARLRRLPFAVVDFDPGPGISSVRVDARMGCYAAAKHLIELGRRRFGIVSFLRTPGSARLHPPGQSRSPEVAGMPTDQEKLRGYADALFEAGLDVNGVPMVQADPWNPAALSMILDAAPDATAILSMSVMQAIGVIKEARRRGLSVPRDLSVVGYNDIPDAERSDPPLTTVDGLGLLKGRTAARIVFENGPPRHEILHPRADYPGLDRTSTGALKNAALESEIHKSFSFSLSRLGQQNLDLTTISLSIDPGAVQADLTKGKIKHGKDSLTLGNDERSVRPLDKVSTRKKRRYSDPDCA